MKHKMLVTFCFETNEWKFHHSAWPLNNLLLHCHSISIFIVWIILISRKARKDSFNSLIMASRNMSISKKLPFGIHSILADDPSSLISSNSMGCESNAFIIFPIPSIYKSFSTFPYSVHDLSKIFNETSEENSNRTLNISILNKIGSQSQNYFLY